MAKKTWVYNLKKKPRPKVPDSVKAELKQKADSLIQNVLKPEYIKPPPEDSTFNYIVDIFSKWYRGYFYFCSTYNCPGPTAISPSFNDNFARLEYVGRDKFNLAYMRHTGQWFEIGLDLSLQECLDEIEKGHHFTP
jgi:hypothetical protein